MKLKEAKIGHLYSVTDIKFCDECIPDEQSSCMILSLMTRGLVPGCELTVISKKLGMYEMKIDGTHLVIRQPEAERFNIEVE